VGEIFRLRTVFSILFHEGFHKTLGKISRFVKN